MAARFILGRAGSGKTHHCIYALARALGSEAPLGPRRILLVPEQASLQTEKALLAASADQATHRGEVLSFRFLAYRLLADGPQRTGRILSRAGRAMVLQQIGTGLAQAHRLRYFRANRLLPGLYHELGDQIQELIAAGIRPEGLELDQEDAGPPDSLAAKIHDLRLFYAAYLAFLATGHVDPLLLLDQARGALDGAEWLTDAELWVDGFASFSMQEMALLASAAAHCAQTRISLLLDPSAPGVLDDRTADPLSLFRTTEQTYRRLRGQLVAAGVCLEPPLVLGGGGPNPRFAHAADLARLESGLFGSTPQNAAGADNIVVFEAADPRQELLETIHQIRQLVRRPHDPLRYREIAIITRSLEHHHHLMATLFDSHGIPYFLDRRRPLREHPLHQFMISLLQLGLQPFGLQPMRRLLKSPLLGEAVARLDAVENYILAHNIAGPAAWARPWTRPPGRPSSAAPKDADQHPALRRLNATRQKLLDLLSDWTGASDACCTAAAWARRLYGVLQRLGAGKRVATWESDARQAHPKTVSESPAGAAPADHPMRPDGLDAGPGLHPDRSRRHGSGSAAAAEHHREAWGAVVQLFDDLVAALGASAMSMADFVSTFQAGLAQLETGLVPPSLDCVLVATIERSRHPDIRAAFVLGFNDGAFPQVRRAQKLLNDEDRRVLLQRGFELDPPASERLDEERLLAYIALTRARDYLHVSYCKSDLDGIAQHPSPYLADIEQALGTLPLRPRPAGFREEVAMMWSPDEFATTLALHAGNPWAASRAESRLFWDALYEAARKRPSCAPLLRRALAGLEEPARARLDPQAARAWAGPILRTSVTALESHAACPFKFYSQHMLALKPRPLGRMDALHLGALYHDVLHHFTVGLLQERLTLADLPPAQLGERLDLCLAQYRRQSDGVLAPAPGPGEPFLWERARDQLLAALEAQRRFQAAGSCRTVAAELQFGYDGEGLPARDLRTADGHSVQLRGKIDRVDLARTPGGQAGFIYDYKRSRSKLLRAMEVRYGLSLQLLTYLTCLAQYSAGEVEAAGAASPAAGTPGPALIPGGAFYLSLVPPYAQVHHPDERSDPHEPYRPRGLFDGTLLKLLDPDIQPGHSSDVVAARLNNDGGLGANNDGIGSEAFDTILRHVTRIIAQVCDAILAGRIEVAPYRLGRRMPCAHCDHRPFCRVEPAIAARDLSAHRVAWEDVTP